MTPRFLLLLAALSASAASAQSPTTADSVRTAFEAYRTALVAADPAATALAVSPETLAYYDAMVDAALAADSATVAALPLADRLMVFSMRHRVPVDTLRAFRSGDAFRYGVANGWIDGLGLRLIEAGDVVTAGDSGTVQLMVQDRPLPNGRLPVRRGSAGWKVDLSAMQAQTGAEFERMAAEMGQTADAFLIHALELLTGRPVGPEVWKPVGH